MVFVYMTLFWTNKNKSYLIIKSNGFPIVGVGIKLTMSGEVGQLDIWIFASKWYTSLWLNLTCTCTWQYLVGHEIPMAIGSGFCLNSKLWVFCQLPCWNVICMEWGTTGMEIRFQGRYLAIKSCIMGYRESCLMSLLTENEEMLAGQTIYSVHLGPDSI